jgi:hypothetical protein
MFSGISSTYKCTDTFWIWFELFSFLIRYYLFSTRQQFLVNYRIKAAKSFQLHSQLSRFLNTSFLILSMSTPPCLGGSILPGPSSSGSNASTGALCIPSQGLPSSADTPVSENQCAGRFPSSIETGPTGSGRSVTPSVGYSSPHHPTDEVSRLPQGHSARGAPLSKEESERQGANVLPGIRTIGAIRDALRSDYQVAGVPSEPHLAMNRAGYPVSSGSMTSIAENQSTPRGGESIDFPSWHRQCPRVRWKA